MDPAFGQIGRGLTAHKVLGLPLYPLTIGHVFLLTEYDVNFMVDEAIEPSLGDLLLFTFFAAQPTEREARRAASSPLARPLFWFWGFLSRRRNLFVEFTKLREYIASQSVSPHVATPQGEVKYLNAPEHWRLLAMLMADFHLSIREAMDTTLNFARALWAVQGERTDKLSLAWTPGTSAALDRLKERGLVKN